MKRMALFISLLLAGCGLEFPDRYDRVDNDRVRPLAFVFDNRGLAEGAPGDTVDLHAYFAGEEVNRIQWTISTTVLLGSFGVDTYYDVISLQSLVVPGSYMEYSGGLTDSVVFSFVLPWDIIRRKYEYVSTMGEILPSEVRDSVPPELLMVKPVQVIDILDFLASRPDGVDSLMVDSMLRDIAGEDAPDFMPLLLQALSVTMKIFSYVNDKCKVESDFTIRYNSTIRYLNSSVQVNRNPVIEWMKLYKVRGSSLLSFHPVKDASLVDAVYDLKGVFSDTVLIEDGYSYFLIPDPGTASLDYGMSMTSGSLRPETFHHEWFYRNDYPPAGQDHDKLLMIQRTPGSKDVKLLPPLDRRAKHFSLWLVTYDSYMGERLRPVGFCFRAFHGVFEYR